jgi:hypothetical protein
MGNARAADAIAISLGVGVAISVSRRAPKSKDAPADAMISSSVSVTAVDACTDGRERGAAEDAIARRGEDDDDVGLASVRTARARGITARMHRGSLMNE